MANHHDLQSRSPSIQQVLPISEPVFLILLSLVGHPRHGYGMIKEVAELSEQRVMLSTGTLFGAIKRLLADGWVERVPPPEPDQDGRDRKYYRLTSQGHQVLKADVQRMRSLSQLADVRLAGQVGYAED
jgi:DNA-binding PadR family transcriptional regulator